MIARLSETDIIPSIFTKMIFHVITGKVVHFKYGNITTNAFNVLSWKQIITLIHAYALCFFNLFPVLINAGLH